MSSSVPAAERAESSSRLIVKAVSPRNISAVYVLLVLCVVFAIWLPDTFPTSTTLKTLLNEQAITAMVAIGLTIALAAGAYDLSVGLTLGMSAIVVAWLVGPHSTSPGLAVAAGLGVGVTVGLVNGLLVTIGRIHSFIATIGVGSCLAAGVTWVSGDQHIVGLETDFQNIATGQLLGIGYPVYYLLGLIVVSWYVLEQTPAGRYLYATGANPEAARLSGVPIARLLFGALLVCGAIAGIAGVLETARIGAGSPDVGPGYLLPAFAAAFLGSTQIRPGHFNVFGTVLAVYLLATGVKGLQLAGAPFWLPDLFDGLALLLAVGLSRRTDST